ncbi:carbohydrate-binding module family 18 protein, partial [Piromyces sp. E2]
GDCESGYCCSKYGWCGKSDDHSFALISTVSAAPSTYSGDRCGPEYGDCESGYCCSEYGWCGTSEDHCSISKGCQPEYGICDQQQSNVSTNRDRCGPGYGECYSGYCCSKYGWCGKSDDHC